MTGRPDWLSSWQAAHSAETSSGPRSCISSMKMPMPLPTSAASPPRSVKSSTRSISMSPESARPRTAAASMPGLHWSLSFAPGAGVAVREGLDDAEDVVDRLLVAVPELAHGLVQRAAQRTAQPLAGSGLELAGAPALAYGGAAQGVEQHGLADAAQPGEHEAALGTALGDPLEDDARRRRAARRGRRARAGAGPRRGRTGSGSGPRSDPIEQSRRTLDCRIVGESAGFARPVEPLDALAGGVVGLVEPRRSSAIRSGTSSAASRKVPAQTLSRHSESTTSCGSWCQVTRSERSSPRGSRKTAPVRGSALLGHVPL